MPNAVIPKTRSLSAGAPLSADLSAGELATNTLEGRLFLKLADGTVKEFTTGGGSASAATTTALGTVKISGTPTDTASPVVAVQEVTRSAASLTEGIIASARLPAEPVFTPVIGATGNGIITIAGKGTAQFTAGSISLRLDDSIAATGAVFEMNFENGANGSNGANQFSFQRRTLTRGFLGFAGKFDHNSNTWDFDTGFRVNGSDVVTTNDTRLVREPISIALGAYTVLTSVGTAYDAIAPAKGLGLALIDFTGCTKIEFRVFSNKVGSGTQSWQLWDVTGAVQVGVIGDAGAAGDKVLALILTAGLPTGLKLVRVRAKSTTAADAPVYYGSTLHVTY